MGWQETAVANEIMIELSKQKVVLWKNVRGLFWSLDKTHKVKAGLLCDHSADLIGYKMVTVTPDMVNTQVAIFVGIECKTADGRIDDGQDKFAIRLRDRGGKAGIARSVEDALKIIS